METRSDATFGKPSKVKGKQTYVDSAQRPLLCHFSQYLLWISVPHGAAGPCRGAEFTKAVELLRC